MRTGRFLIVPLLPALLPALLVTVATAAPIIHGESSLDSLGNYHLLPDTPNQPIRIYVRGGDAVQAVNLNVQTADGGPEALGASGTPAPRITSVDLFTGTIFENNNTGLGSAAGVLVPQVAFFSTTTASGTVAADGLLATITLDTTGFTEPAVFPLVLSQTLNNRTNFGLIDAVVLDGTLTIVPEPAMAALLALSAMAGRRLRRT